MLKKIWRNMRSIMAVKKKYIIVVGCVAAIVILAVLNVWSVYSDKDDVGVVGCRRTEKQ